MGLDYDISVKIKRRKTGEVLRTIEIAYWRKFWSLRTKTMNVAMANPDKVIKYDADWRLEVKPEVLEDIMDIHKQIATKCAAGIMQTCIGNSGFC